jgi:NAD(P)-dependent dehydrogenase (short-subunit alcohol dehydrogenase family)
MSRCPPGLASIHRLVREQNVKCVSIPLPMSTSSSNISEKRVAFVTGASRGIGRSIAQRLARDGRHVVLVSRTAAPLSDLASQIKDTGGSASFKAVDVADGAAFAKAIDEVVTEHGRLDILVNNAGITKDGLVLRMSDEDWNAVIQTNLTSAFVAIRAAAREMMKKRSDVQPDCTGVHRDGHDGEPVAGHQGRRAEDDGRETAGHRRGHRGGGELHDER